MIISLFTGACIGSASAGFLLSLDWVTGFREGHLWLVALLPAGGFLVGLLYHYWGREVEGGNNL
ncbi:MAG: chloride channel protein, partial [Leadbetterella sp.]|nr:chloride channel protein [Leadbetterella sp.]